MERQGARLVPVVERTAFERLARRGRGGPFAQGSAAGAERRRVCGDAEGRFGGVELEKFFDAIEPVAVAAAERRFTQLAAQNMHVGQDAAGRDVFDLVHRLGEQVIDELIAREAAGFQQLFQAVVCFRKNSDARVVGHDGDTDQESAFCIQKILLTLNAF
mgnify:CR=1 FL=1